VSDARWRRIEEIVEQALELVGLERGRFLAQACGDDAALRAEVEALLGREESGGPDFLEPPELLEPRAPKAEAARHALGEFELLRELGRGGMGVVYLARQERLGREVAVKVLVAGLWTSERDIERFHREARSVARLRHPGIVQVFADGQVGGTHWFAMEYVPGHDLGRELQLQKAQRVFEREAPFLPRPGEPEHAATLARVCADVADALQCAHEAGLVHRDIKPQNLLLQANGRVQVGDFGLVRDEELGGITRTGELAGSPHYMSPEQAHVLRAAVDHRTDVYSLGVVLYELATHRRPYEGKTSADILTQIRDTHPENLRAHNAQLPRDLETICLKAMAKDPRERYATAAELGADLRRFLAHEAIVARPPTPASLALRWLRRHRSPVAGILLLSGGLGVGTLLARRAAAAERSARLEVELSTPAGKALNGSVGLRPIDPITGAVGELLPLGPLPLRQAGIEPGYYRIVVDLGAAGARVFARELARGEALEIRTLAREAPVDVQDMILLPGGTLALRDADRPLTAVNQRDVAVQGFYLDTHEVSNAEYRAFLDATGHPAPRHWAEIERGTHDRLPVVQVGYLDALAYAEWRGKRLPSFPEWLWAARGAENRLYPWPDAFPGALRGNVLHPLETRFAWETEDYLRLASPVDSHPDARTASGIFHLFGNVAEWTESLPGEPVEGGFEPRLGQRLIAGHDWFAGAKLHDLTTFAFNSIERTFADFSTGFRCALSAEP
jgi:serine/threonine protein kinase/formylglycine-generating enzyme required for sulfatase activity